MGGRTPKPADATTGNHLPGDLEKRRAAEPQIEFDEKDFVPPEELDEVAREHWLEQVEIFKRFRGNIVNVADRRLLQILCECWSDKIYYDDEIKSIRKQLAEKPESTKELYAQESKYCGMREKVRANYISTCDRLQLSPTSRARIGKGRADNPEDDNFF